MKAAPGSNGPLGLPNLAAGPVSVPALAASVLTAAAIGLGSAGPAVADEYLKPEDFVRDAFAGAPPPPAVLWPDAALQSRMRAVLGHPYKQLRIRYWREAQRTAWVLDEVGKDEEITIGFVVAADAIERTEVLAFRESRGWEIRFPSFTSRFKGAALTPKDELDRPVDGITGATLSVRAYQRLARLALMLHDAAVKK